MLLSQKTSVKISQKKTIKVICGTGNFHPRRHQETCKLLDKAWKSFYALKKSGGVREPNPPRFKKQNMRITYMQMGIVHETGTDRIRLSLPKELKIYMEKEYGTQNEPEIPWTALQ